MGPLVRAICSGSMRISGQESMLRACVPDCRSVFEALFRSISAQMFLAIVLSKGSHEAPLVGLLPDLAAGCAATCRRLADG